MLKLPKIDEESAPLKQQYNQILIVRSNQPKKYQEFKASKYDWVKCELSLVQPIFSEVILQELVNFQNMCKEKCVEPFYSYFFLKSLFLNKDLTSFGQKIFKSQESKQNSKINQEEQSKDLEIFIIQSLKQESQKIELECSMFHKIQNYIFLREELLKQIQFTTKQESHNFIHQNVDNLRMIIYQILQLVKGWKQELHGIQSRKFHKYNQLVDSQLSIQPIFCHDGQNYLCKMVHDNANVINTLNEKNQLNFISPPNPFFLSQDGNKQSMSHKQKQKIEEAIEYFAKEKALEIRLLLDPPEYIVKGKGLEDRIKSSRKLNEKPLQKALNTNERKYKSLVISKKQRDIEPKWKTNFQGFKQKYVSVYNQHILKQNQMIIASNRLRTSKLREQVQMSARNRGQSQNMNKKQYLKAIIKDVPIKTQQQSLPKIQIQFMTKKEKLNERSNKQRMSALRRQVQKNFDSINRSKQHQKIQIQKISQSGISMNKTQKFIEGLLINIKAPKPKMKIIVQRQVQTEKIVNSPVKMSNKPLQDKSKSRQKQGMRKSRSTFYKLTKQDIKQEELRRSITNKEVMTISRIRNRAPSIQSAKFLPRSITDVNHLATSTNFLYKPKKISKNLENIINKKPIIKLEGTSKQIDRKLSILKSYGQKISKTHIKRLSNNEQLLTMANQNKIDSDQKLKNSPYRNSKSKSKLRQQSALFFKKQAFALEQKIQKLLLDQQKDKSLLLQKQSGRDEENTIINGFKSVLQGQDLTEYQSKIDQGLKKLEIKKQLIEQNNEIKQKQIQMKKKAKLKLSEEIEEGKQRLGNLEKEILLMKKKKNSVANQTPKISSCIEKNSEKFSEIDPVIKQLKERQANIQKQNAQIQQLMEAQQKKFVKLKQEQFQQRQQLNKKKYLQSLKQLKSNFIQKQQDYERRILYEQRMRKQNQIQLIKQKRQTEQLQMKLQEQQIKQHLLKSILQKEQEKLLYTQNQTVIYQEELKKKIQKEIRQKEAEQKRINEMYEEQNRRMVEMMQEIKLKNQKMEVANKIRMDQVEKTIKEKQEEIKKLQDLQKQVGKFSRIYQNEEASEMGLIPGILSNERFEQTELLSMTVQSEEGDLQTLKLRLKDQILKQLDQRNRKMEEQELKYEQERKKVLALLEDQIKELLKIQDQMVQQINQGKFVEAQVNLAIVKTAQNPINDFSLKEGANQIYQN